MKSQEQVKNKIIDLSKQNKVGSAGTSIRAWIDALHWVLD